MSASSMHAPTLFADDELPEARRLTTKASEKSGAFLFDRRST